MMSKDVECHHNLYKTSEYSSDAGDSCETTMSAERVSMGDIGDHCGAVSQLRSPIAFMETHELETM